MDFDKVDIMFDEAEVMAKIEELGKQITPRTIKGKKSLSGRDT